MWKDVDNNTKELAVTLAENYYYFAYGSNINMTQMIQRCSKSKPYCVGFLSDYKLMFRNVADITKARGKKVFGSLYKVASSDILSLNVFEGYPSKYIIKTGTVNTDRGVKNVFWYEINNKNNHLSSLPKVEYLRKILEGYSTWRIPDDMIYESLLRCGNSVKRRKYKEITKQYSEA